MRSRQGTTRIRLLVVMLGLIAWAGTPGTASAQFWGGGMGPAVGFYTNTAGLGGLDLSGWNGGMGFGMGMPFGATGMMGFGAPGFGYGYGVPGFGFGFPGFGYGYGFAGGFGLGGLGLGFGTPIGFGYPGVGGFGFAPIANPWANPLFGVGLTPLGTASYTIESNQLGRAQIQADLRARLRRSGINVR
jgi:hypothetical protein